ncbi:MAG TPA: endonuclease III [Chlamydiales bacterium]|nr:endonuclease III [Chlamydiales bacterium]
MRNKKELAKEIGNVLDKLFPNPAIPLHHESPFTLLIAVLLSAQCTDVRVNQVTPKLFALAGTPETMALLNPKEIEAIIRPCGLAPTKSRAIQKLSELLVAKHKSKVPSSLKALEKLPGVGHKTASVILAQSFHKPAFPVDTHIFRAAHRWHLSKGKTVVQVEKDLKKLFPKKEWIRRHLQIIYFCREYCPARGHKPERCPICSFLTKCQKNILSQGPSSNFR